MKNQEKSNGIVPARIIVNKEEGCLEFEIENNIIHEFKVEYKFK